MASWFGNDKKKPEVKKPVEQKKSIWDEDIAAALPKKSQYFEAMRTDAYAGETANGKFIEWDAALKVDAEQDKWVIMHYIAYEPEKPDGLFDAEVLKIKPNKESPAMILQCTFAEAMTHLSQRDSLQKGLAAGSPDVKCLAEMTEEIYPPEAYPELQIYYFDIEEYRTVAAVHHIAFDDMDRPFPTVEGKVFGDARLLRSEVSKPITMPGDVRSNPKIAAKIEGGILSDIYNSSATKEASLENLLKVSKTLASLDLYVEQIGAYYLSVQKVLGLDDKFDKMTALPVEERTALYNKAEKVRKNALTDEKGVADVLPQAKAYLQEAKDQGAHTAPFEKFAAECELYTLLLSISIDAQKLKGAVRNIGAGSLDTIASIEKAEMQAKKKFRDLGGSEEEVDRLMAWAANSKDRMPQWLPGFVNRYYDQRRKVMAEVQKRQSVAVATMSAKVKPPVI